MNKKFLFCLAITTISYIVVSDELPSRPDRKRSRDGSVAYLALVRENAFSENMPVRVSRTPSPDPRTPQTIVQQLNDHVSPTPPLAQRSRSVSPEQPDDLIRYKITTSNTISYEYERPGEPSSYLYFPKIFVRNHSDLVRAIKRMLATHKPKQDRSGVSVQLRERDSVVVCSVRNRGLDLDCVTNFSGPESGVLPVLGWFLKPRE